VRSRVPLLQGSPALLLPHRAQLTFTTECWEVLVCCLVTVAKVDYVGGENFGNGAQDG
jgi:hypothetical protein